MKVLVLGSGGREHALAWRIAKDKSVSEVFLHPGNAGTWKQGIPTLGDVSLHNREALATAAEGRGVSLIVVGAEAQLAQGYGDFFREQGFSVVGPGVKGAQLETSKAFAKRFLEDGAIPTGRYTEARTPEGVRAAIKSFPVVLKLDGLAAGKGVVVALSVADSESFINRVWNLREFGPGEPLIVVEEFLPGRELSFIGLCDGKTFLPLSSASDYKRLADGDLGPNTGGMGAISPSPVETPALLVRIQDEVVAPTLRQLAKQGLDFRGVLYFGLMISPDGKPYVLEFNTRFGDPETQALMLRLQGDFTALLQATAEGKLGDAPVPHWSDDTALYVVGSAEGYPSAPRTGDQIEGLEGLSPETAVFFSGVGGGSHGLVTQGGRVLGLGVVAKGAENCRSRLYAAFAGVRWAGMHYRRDIGL
jgi:phosphoribosylamine---glycine ligase